MALWLFIGVCLVAPDLFVPEKAKQHIRNGEMVGILAFVFAAYNLARWWATQSLYRRREHMPRANPLSVRKVEEEERPYENNPDLDFFKPGENHAGESKPT